MALTADRNTPERDGVLAEYPVAASTRLYAGGMAALNASGYCVPASADAALVVVGRAEEEVDNSSGSDGDLDALTKRGVFQFGNSSGSDEITLADVGRPAYVVDDATLAKTSNSGVRPVAGEIVDVDAGGVWVKLGHPGLAADPDAARALLGANKIHLAIPVDNLAGGTAAVYRFVAPVAGQITKLTSILEGALTVGDATITPSIGGVAITGGALSIAQADSAAGDIDTATPSAANTVTAGQGVALTVGGTNTATVSAMVMVEITF
jgi:hypothetical protein